MDLPTGTVTFLFTDIEGSTDLWERDEAATRQVLVRHDEIIEQLVEQNEGKLVRPRGEGDSRFAVFEMAPRSVAAAVKIQQAFATEPWPTEEPLRIRIGLHTGNADLREGDYYGSAVNRCARVRSLAHGGQVLLSLATEQLTSDYLPEGVEIRDLGVHPLKGLKRPEQVFQLVIPDVPSDFAPLQTRVGPKHNLPEQPTTFVGRDAEIREVRGMLAQDGVRLITLKGPGGIGKTRLSIEVARQEVDRFTDGARFVALAPLDTADQIVQAFLEALDLRPASQEEPRDVLLEHLRRSDILIVVDNFEHVLDGAPFMADILERSAKVKLLATSRERLGLRGESVYDVAGLEFSDWHTVEEAVSSSCGKLFIQGARQLGPEFELEKADVQHVARICRLVDGAPLALLLSAGWIDMLSVKEIADEVEASLDFLETELRDAPARQRSIKAVFDTSWERLEQPERELFMRLSVFRGGFTRRAAQDVADADLRSLARLTDKSFLHREPATGRYEIHEMLRQYGEQRLGAREGADGDTRQRHAMHFAEMLAAKETPLMNGIEVEPLDEIEADIENIRTAWGTLARSGRADAIGRSLFSLWLFHEVRCWLHAGMELFASTERTLRRGMKDEQDEKVANQLQAARAFHTLIVGFAEEGVEAARHTLDWLREHGYREQTTYSLLTLGVAGNFTGKPDQAIAYGDELSALGKAMGNSWWELRGKTMAAGGCLILGDSERCEQYLQEYDELIEAIRGPWNSYWGKMSYARLAEAHGDYDKAKEIDQSIIDSLQSVSFLRGIQYAHTSLGRMNLALEDLEEAEYNYAQSLQISQETGQFRDALGNLTGLAKVWRRQGRGAEAVEAVASVMRHAQIDQANLLMGTSIREEAEEIRSQLEHELEPGQYAAAWEAGSGEEAEDVISRVLSAPVERLQAASSQ